MIHDHALVIHNEKYDQHVLTQIYNLLYDKQRNLLYVSANYCDHLQGGVL